ncbi:hypothetical protein [Methylocella sp.]|uniref:hypothetical protein n=1 Tax=Methylocella sp. TaxID=1978226 RepID=UPI003C1C1335
MDNKIIGLLGVMSLVGTMDAALAATPADSSQGALPKAGSYSELLDPIPNAVALLAAADAAGAQAPQAGEKTPPEGVQVAQNYHHHHHHQRNHRRHHHHHHHHQGY